MHVCICTYVHMYVYVCVQVGTMDQTEPCKTFRTMYSTFARMVSLRDTRHVHIILLRDGISGPSLLIESTDSMTITKVFASEDEKAFLALAH